MASSTPSGCCRQTVHEVLCPCARVGHAAEPANIVVHPRRVSANVDVATSSRGDCCAVLPQDRTGPFQLRPGLGRVTQYRAHDLSIDRGVALDHPLSRLAVGVIALQVRRGGETCGVEGARHLIGIGTVEFDLNAEGLVGIPDHVLPLVLAARSPGQLEQLAMKLVVGCQRPLAFGHL